MTNVVGILIIVLVVTQLQVAEALKRIESNLPEVSEEELKQLKVRVEQERKNRQQLETTWTDMEPKEKEEDKDLQQLILNIDETVKVRDELLKDDKDIDGLKALLEARKTEVEARSETVLNADEELQKMKALLDETPEREVKPAKVVNLPDPRPAPDNAEPRYVLCKGNRVYFVGDVYDHLFKVRDFIDGRFKDFVYRGPGMGTYTYTVQLDKKRDDGNWEILRDREDRAYQKFRYDAAAISEYFDKNKVGGDDIYYEARRASKDNDYMSLRIVPREEGGASVEEFKQRNSALDNAFKQVGINRNYLMFMVAPDSFDAYLEARQMAEFHRIPAGWQLWDGEFFLPKTAVPRETMEIMIEDLPIADIKAVAGMVGRYAKANVATAEQKASAVTDGAQKVEAEKYVRRFISSENAINSAAAVAENMREGRREVRVAPQAPNIPLVRVFEVTEVIPGGGTAPVQEGSKDTKKEAPPKKVDTLD
ncbi:MAG: hypothetical protein AAF591_14195 [Verrucomicrobiota bacterium]